jgi:transcription elongation factor GreA
MGRSAWRIVCSRIENLLLISTIRISDYGICQKTWFYLTFFPKTANLPLYALEQRVFLLFSKRFAMTIDKIPMTVEGFNTLEAELKNLKSVERPAVIAAIAEARAHGDLSENAEYHAARERQSFIEGRIKELEAATSIAQIIDPTTLSGDMVKFGATVVIYEEETDEELKFQIVGKYESNADGGKISITAPIARSMIGKSVGDVVEVQTPKGRRHYEILMVMYV